MGLEREGAPVFDLNGTSANITEVLDIIKAFIPDADLTYSGEPLPFPALLDDGKLNAYLDIAPCRSLRQGIGDTLAGFEDAQSRGIDLLELLGRTVEKAG